MKINSATLAGILALLLGGAGKIPGQMAGITDGTISNTIVTVAGFWQQKHGVPADGSYPAATSLTVAQAAAKPANLEWEYAWGVNLYGQLRVKDATGNTNAEIFALNHDLCCARYYAWLLSLTNTLTNTTGLATFQNSTLLGTFFTLGKLDYCGAMTAQMLEGALRHTNGPTIQELQLAMVTADYISTGQTRLPDGTLWRATVSGGTIWADDLYMSCPFLVRWYQYTGNTNYLNDAAHQVISFAGYLQDTNGLWFHGYYVSSNAVNGVKWGRANGWAMMATVEILSVMPANHPARAALLDILRRHIAGVEAVQAPDGMWHQVLDHPEVWEESSCTAMYAYGIARAVNRGWIDPTNLAVARKAFGALVQLEINATGSISNICPGTSLNTNMAYYTNKASLPPTMDDRHGPGPVMLAGAELLLTPKLNIATAGGGAQISWNAGLTNFNLQAATNLAGWGTWTNAPVTTNWQNTVTDTNAAGRFFRLGAPLPGWPATPLVYEAESVVGGAAGTVVADTNASGGNYVLYNNAGAGSSITFYLNNLPGGVYDLRLAFRAGPGCGTVTLAVAGHQVGGTLDEYWPAGNYPVWDFGRVTIGKTGDYAFTLTVTGKNAAASSYAITADAFCLVPQ